jgi:hypothetical protein
MKIGWIFLTACLLASPAAGQAANPPPGISAEDFAALLRSNRNLVARVPAAAGVFTAKDDGTIWHVQSGLVCPGLFPSVYLSQLMVFATSEKGADVGCDYRRPDEKGGAYAKLSIYATKASPDTTLDTAFAGYQQEVAKGNNNVRVLGPAIKAGGSPPGEVRSEEYLVTWNDRDYASDLLVALQAGWVIEVRATYVGKPDEIAEAKTGLNSASLATADRAMALIALDMAMKTVGRDNAPKPAQ